MDALEEVIEDLEEKVLRASIPNRIFSEMKNLDEDRLAESQERASQEKSEEVAYNIVKEAINTRTKKPRLKERQGIRKAVKKNVQTISVKVEEDTIDRYELYNRPELRNTSKGKSGLLVKNKIDPSSFEPYGREASLEEIRKALIGINNFIGSYEKFAFKYTDEYGQRIIEAIFYTFTSPFLFEIKRLARINEERNDIPQFLFLGGKSGSGKSSLLSILAKSLGIASKDNYYYVYSELHEGLARAKSERIKTFKGWANSENVYPIFVDEIDIDFFSNNSYGRDLILSTTNNKVDRVPAFPTFIGTTNAANYSLPDEAKRRSYYLLMDKVINPDQREESSLVFNQIKEEYNETLFKDFAIRMAQRLENPDDYEWNHFGSSGGKVDFLYQTREIFKAYYEMCQMPLPRYFPTERYTDDKESSQEKWKKLYRGSSQKDFIFDEYTGNLIFDTTSIDENSKRLYGTPSSEIYKQALPPQVIHGSTSGIDIELDTKEFFDWLDLDNPYKDYYKNKLIEIYNENKEEIDLADGKFKIKKSLISQATDIAEKTIDAISKEIYTSQDEDFLYLDKEEFYAWANIKEEKKSFLDRIFG